MPTGNPLDQLRRRKQSHATPAAFAALAEEHRRAGRFAEAITVCRDGLERYPAYVSARVTLGRALLDSGDPVTAVTELEQAVTQAPDNLAAMRTLDAARAACADLPDLAPPPPLEDLTLHRAAVPAADPLPLVGDFPSESDPVVLPPIPDVPYSSLTGGADVPQEFGLRDDWTLPDLPPRTAAGENAWDAPAPSIETSPDGPETLVITGHGDALTTYFTAPPLQGEEPAGIWPVPSTAEAEAEGGAVEAEAVFSWAPEAPGEPGEPSESSIAMPTDLAEQAGQSTWDDHTIVVSRPVVEDVAVAPVSEEAAPGLWTGLFEEPVGDGAEPSAFAGWDAPGPSTPDKPAWGSEESDAQDTGMWTVPAAPADESTLAPGASTFTWGEPVEEAFLDPARQLIPEANGEDVEAGVQVPEAVEAFVLDPIVDEPMWGMSEGVIDADQAGLVEDVPVEPVMASGIPGDADGAADRASRSTWAGSVASALDEVFRQAGQPHAAPMTVEAPAPADDPYRATMAAAAVEAALDDTARRGDASTSALVSLQQMLEAVRARRAALFTDIKH
jgi:hypothetical protein